MVYYACSVAFALPYFSSDLLYVSLQMVENPTPIAEFLDGPS
jgi:hypothetical protein